ncbi:hypothetical protein PORY_000925 [Pneumocystis oryctolagi]|uniref:Uncharacterized protein n=1 Tax=Pneumocystis oryctolagi TaxID=42067 RepID=A0ACB7CEQ8_9ASCO|nr:hypothetical protein PORY_000925 [Pneumocystis oryctolagi]
MSIDLSKNKEIKEPDLLKKILEEKKELKNEIELRQKDLLTELFILCSLQKYFPDVGKDICEKISSSNELKMFLTQNSLMNGSNFDASTLQKYIFSEEISTIPLKDSKSSKIVDSPSVNILSQGSEKVETYEHPKRLKYKIKDTHLGSTNPCVNAEPILHSSDYTSPHVLKYMPNYQQNKTNRTDMLSWLIQTSAMPMYKLMQSSSKIIVTKDWNSALIETKFMKVLERINKLKENNSWSFRQMIKQKTPSRLKAHWDFMLDEMRWLQTDFKEERKWKIVLAKQMANWALSWHKLKAKYKTSIQSNSIDSHMSPLMNEKYSINCNFSDSLKNKENLSQNSHEQDKRNNENIDFDDIESNIKDDFSENIVMLHSSPLFIIENAVQLLEIPPDKIIATFPNLSLTSNIVLPELPLYQPPVPEDTLYYDPLDEMKIIPLSKYTQSHIKITHSDKFFKKRKREMSPIDTDDTYDKQRTVISDFSLSNSQASTPRKKSYPSQLRPPNISLNSENRKPIWTPDEDDLLMTYLPKYQFNWEFVAQTLTPSIKWISPLEKKTAWDCFERWVQLDPHASNVVFVGPYAKIAYTKLEPLLKNAKTNNYGGLFRSKKDAGKNQQNIKFKRQRQLNMFDAIRKTMKKREVSQKLNVGPSKKVNIINHDTHGLSHKPSVAAPTPLDLSRLKHERDQVITQAYIRQRNAVVALALQNQARSSGRSNLPGMTPTAQQIAQMQSTHSQMNVQNSAQSVSRTIPSMVNGLRFTRSVRPSIPGQTSNPSGATPVLRLPPGTRLSQEQMQQLILQRQQLLQAQCTQTQTIQQTAPCSDSEQNDISSGSRCLTSLNQHRQVSIQNHGSSSLVPEHTLQSQQPYPSVS